MEERSGTRRKADVLREALDSLWPDLPGARLIAFGSTAREVDSPGGLPAPSGGTALHLALDAAAASRPRKTVVVTDGRPDSEQAALDAAARASGLIDVVYCGPDSDAAALDFLRRLTRVGGGVIIARDIAKDSKLRLAPAIRDALGLPAPKGKGA
jgi:hypothetical protein